MVNLCTYVHKPEGLHAKMYFVNCKIMNAMFYSKLILNIIKD